MKKPKLICARVYRACVGCPGPHQMEMSPLVAERLGELGFGVTCASCPQKESHQELQRKVDERGGTCIYTQERLEEVLREEQPILEAPKLPNLLELMEA